MLTIPNVHLQRGATIVAYSGGKAICGPQCAGLLLGRKDLLMSAWQASAPHHGPGRDNKVGREETLGMLAAVEAWVTRDHDADWKTWLSWLDNISRRVSTIAGVITLVLVFTRHRWAPLVAAITGFQVALGTAAVHLLPHWSSFSDALPGSRGTGITLFSWIVVNIEIAGALLLGIFGATLLFHERQARGLATEDGP